MVKIPCEECLKFPICIYKMTLKCRDVFNYLYTHHKSYSGGSTTRINLNGVDQSYEAVMNLEKVYGRSIISTAPVSNKIHLSGMINGLKRRNRCLSKT